MLSLVQKRAGDEYTPFFTPKKPKQKDWCLQVWEAIKQHLCDWS